VSAWRYIAGFLTVAAVAAGPEYAALDKAYAALRAKDYDSAIARFSEASALAPQRVDILKDLAYTYLKIGENEFARDRFGEAMKLNPADEHVALEYAFLCHETKEQAAARRVFDRIRRTGNATAERAFQNIDTELLAGIQRWSRAVELQPDNFSGHEELARLAYWRDDLRTAAEHYERAWRLRPERRDLLLRLGEVWRAAGKAEQANAALLAASRGAEPRTAEAARELLPGRYPYVYEFENALQIDPSNISLRRELAYLLLEMGKREAAEVQFRNIVANDQADVLSTAQLGFLLLNRNQVADAMPLLERALQSSDDVVVDRVREALRMPKVLRKRPETPRTQTSHEAKTLADRSLEAGYLKDAVKYLRIAHENDPVDFDVMLKLGWAYNMLKDDEQAIDWFRLARRSSDAKIAGDANRAYRNLRSSLARVHTSAWMFPFYSSRWKDVFTYAQVKTEYKLNSLPVRLYLSTRFSGDTRGTIHDPNISLAPQGLSESAAIPGVGISMQPWRGATLWGEAGYSFSYLHQSSRGPDYRGGISYMRAFGKGIGGESSGFFGEATADGVFVSRFDNDFLVYSQNKFGWTLAGLQTQIHWNWNLTTDVRRLPWANTIEQGPGLRFHVPGAPKSVLFSVSALQGAYTIMKDNPRPKRYTDWRVGLWYAFSR
jgi:Tfp pilus assembly protein PilF